MFLSLPLTKTGPNKWAEITPVSVRELVRAMIRGCGPDEPVFDFSPAVLREKLKAATRDVGLTENYVFHSLRHGGATHKILSGYTMEDVMRLGRWAFSKSAIRYIQSGRALLLAVNVSPVVALAAKLCSPRIYSFLLARI